MGLFGAIIQLLIDKLLVCLPRLRSRMTEKLTVSRQIVVYYLLYSHFQELGAHHSPVAVAHSQRGERISESRTGLQLRELRLVLYLHHQQVQREDLAARKLRATNS